MKQKVMLHICGKQHYEGQDPDVIELVTAGTMEKCDDGWEICYEESEMTGLAGVTTIFRREKGKVTLSRKGKLQSQMVFQEGMTHDSLYQSEFGALLISVCAKKITADLSENGGTVELCYTISVEYSATGTVEYCLQVEPIKV